MRTPSSDSIVLASLTLVVSALVVVMWRLGITTPLEGVSVITGALCVWLTVRQSLWNFPISLANNITFGILFFSHRLFADAGLQVVYFVLTCIGWYLWLYGGEQRSRLRVTRASQLELLLTTASGAMLILVLWRILLHFNGSVTFFDALTTAISLCAQWLLNRKKFETWFFWIAADLVYIPMYAYKGLYLTAGLYAVFLVMCVMGLREWRASMRRDAVGDRGFEVLPIAAAVRS